MALRHEIPTHLNVEDKPLLGLTIRQFMELMAGLAGTYGLWNQWPHLVLAGRATLTGLSLLITLACSFLRPAGKGVEEWLFSGLEYLATPRRSVWRPREPDPWEWWPRQSRWQELSPSLTWHPPGGGAQTAHPQTRQARGPHEAKA